MFGFWAFTRGGGDRGALGGGGAGGGWRCGELPLTTAVLAHTKLRVARSVREHATGPPPRHPGPRTAERAAAHAASARAARTRVVRARRRVHPTPCLPASHRGRAGTLWPARMRPKSHPPGCSPPAVSFTRATVCRCVCDARPRAHVQCVPLWSGVIHTPIVWVCVCVRGCTCGSSSNLCVRVGFCGGGVCVILPLLP